MRFWRIFILILTLLLCAVILFGAREEAQEAPGASFSVELSMEGSSERIDLWQADSGESYLILPSWARLEDTSIRVARDGDLLLNGISLTDGMNCGGFSLDTPYPLTGRDGEALGTVCFLQSRNAPTVCIDVSSGSMDYIHADLDNSEPGTIRVYRADGTVDYSGPMESMNGRGQSTWAANKKPYSVTLPVNADLLGMGQAKKWILLANANDSSHLRNKIVLDVSAEVGPPYTPECQWADLYLNGQYAGLYLLCERNEVAPGRVELSAGGSFLVSKDWETRFLQRDRTYFTTDSHAALRVYYSDLSMAELKTLWQSAENAILAGDGIDPVTGQDWQQLIDLDSWARRYLIEEVFGNVDGGIRSQAFFRDGSSGKICAGPVWDYDLVLGNAVAWPKPCPTMIFAHIEGIWGSTWYAELYKKEAFYNRVTELYASEFRPQLQRMLYGQIDAYADGISQAAQLNALRWNTKSAQEETQTLKEYLRDRMAFLDSLWIQNEPYFEVYVRVEDGVTMCYSVRPGDCLPELPSYISNASVTYDGWYSAETDTPFDLTQPIWQDTSIYLKYSAVSAADTVEAEGSSSVFRYGPAAVFLAILLCLIYADLRRTRKEADHG